MAAKKTTAAAAPVKKAVVRRRKRTVTEEMIRERAYFISMSDGGSAVDHWLAAERELLVGA
jgi:hypothetical protein